MSYYLKLYLIPSFFLHSMEEFAFSDSEGEEEVPKGTEDFPGRKEALAFLRWLAYCNRVIRSGS